MSLQTNIRTIIPTIFTGRSLFFYVMLFQFLAFTYVSGKSGQSTDYGPQLTQINQENNFQGNVEIVPKIVVAVIAEQDPNGIFWGLRDTVSGKLLLDYTYQKIWNFKDGFAIVLLNGKFGLIDKTGKEIIQPVYDYPKSELECGFIQLELGFGPVLILDTTGKSVMPMIYGITGFLPCQERITYGQYQYGMVNFNRDTILPFKFTRAYLFSEGFCAASKADETGYNSLYGLYDLNGKEVLPHVFERIDGFYSGRAIVKKNGKYGVIDENGKELFYTEYGRIDRFHNGYAIVYSSYKNGETKVGIIDRNGREVVPAIYQWLHNVYNFSEGMAAMAQNRKYGFVDATGKVVIPFKYDNVQSFINGIAKVWVGWHHVGYINSKGQEIIPPDFEAMDQANLRRYHNKFIIGLKDSIQHVFDYSGKKITTLPYEKIQEFNENDKSYLVSMNNKWGTLDSNFTVKIPIKYESLEPIFPNKIAARKNNKIGFLNLKGNEISSFVYDWIAPFQDNYMEQYENGVAIIGIGGRTGLINSYGKLIIPVKYDEIEDFSHGLAMVKQNNKFGFVDSKGKEIIPIIYDKANPYNGYSAEVTLKDETFQIDSLGNRLKEEEH